MRNWCRRVFFGGRPLREGSNVQVWPARIPQAKRERGREAIKSEEWMRQGATWLALSGLLGKKGCGSGRMDV